MYKVRKRDGKIVAFDIKKISLNVCTQKIKPVFTLNYIL